MPVWRDWKELWRGTVRSITREDWAGLWRQEWRDARVQLMSEQRGEIEGEKKRWKRSLRKVNAVVYGLARRLQPARRILYVAALVLAFVDLFDFRFHSGDWEIRIGGGSGIFIAFLLVELLLAL